MPDRYNMTYTHTNTHGFSHQYPIGLIHSCSIRKLVCHGRVMLYCAGKINMYIDKRGTMGSWLLINNGMQQKSNHSSTSLRRNDR